MKKQTTTLPKAETSRPHITDAVVAGLSFARACVLDRRAEAHNRGNLSWDSSYAEALAALDLILKGHQKAMKKRSVKI